MNEWVPLFPDNENRIFKRKSLLFWEINNQLVFFLDVLNKKRGYVVKSKDDAEKIHRAMALVDFSFIPSSVLLIVCLLVFLIIIYFDGYSSAVTLLFVVSVLFVSLPLFVKLGYQLMLMNVLEPTDIYSSYRELEQRYDNYEVKIKGTE